MSLKQKRSALSELVEQFSTFKEQYGWPKGYNNNIDTFDLYTISETYEEVERFLNERSALLLQATLKIVEHVCHSDGISGDSNES